ncbi:MAG: DUF1127 domain-containing protein [Pseudomonadota bacterium]
MTTIDHHRHVPGRLSAGRSGMLGARIAATLGRALDYLRDRALQSERRAKVLHLKDMDDRMLDDMGISRADLHVALERSVSEDPTLYLERVKHQRTGRALRGVRRR